MSIEKIDRQKNWAELLNNNFDLLKANSHTYTVQGINGWEVNYAYFTIVEFPLIKKRILSVHMDIKSVSATCGDGEMKDFDAGIVSDNWAWWTQYAGVNWHSGRSCAVSVYDKHLHIHSLGHKVVAGDSIQTNTSFVDDM